MMDNTNTNANVNANVNTSANTNVNSNVSTNVNVSTLKFATIYTGNNCTGEPVIIPFMPVKPELAQAYVPYQLYSKIMPAQEALRKGTVFPELVK